MPIYHFTEENIQECDLDKKVAEKILTGPFEAFNINELCYWAGTKEAFGIDFSRWNSNVRVIERESGISPQYHKIPDVYREFLQQFLAYYYPVVDLDIDDEDCI